MEGSESDAAVHQAEVHRTEVQGAELVRGSVGGAEEKTRRNRLSGYGARWPRRRPATRPAPMGCIWGPHLGTTGTTADGYRM